MSVQSEDSIQRVAVIGAGTMGSGIAHVAALAGYSVHLYDVTAELAAAGLTKIRANLEAGVAKGKVTPQDRDRALGAISPTGDLAAAAASADLVVEAAPEDLEMKRDLFRRLGEICSERAILASNTSSLSVSKIASAAPRPERVLGLHFFNPPHIMKLIEIVRAWQTSDGAVAAAVAVAKRMGKEAVVVKDTPGFATSRLGLALGLEAMRMVEQGVADAADIDRAMELGYGHPMGPLRVSDLVGLDVRLAIAETLQRELGEAHFRPPDLLRDKVKAGKLGKKSGEGFYKWPKS
ncbi:MAG: 3-hydroxyacyl-CoA dehydrogenase family protein [Acidobacteria bacterium]|nr:3-hydroxyacyl-CoA dehydrogenase family protein [Acidobacteriota bacterium]